MNIHEEKRKVWSKEQLREAESNGIGSNRGNHGVNPNIYAVDYKEFM
jgi:hypothetical protein